MRLGNNALIMDDGTEYYAHRGIVGLSPELALHEGYDGGLEHGDLPDAHRREIAKFMIEQWTRVLNGEKPPQ